MIRLRSALVLVLCAVSSSAAPSAARPDSQLLAKRQDGPAPVVCGSTYYSTAQLKAATTEGCRLHAHGKAVGTGEYPHVFNNGEKLGFTASGTYHEFPILSSGAPLEPTGLSLSHKRNAPTPTPAP
ncbi:guanyl-specific ribonuclease F1 [Magnaporthiopsis poae ATCC 64411]|uniref:ribonuclease T1 n=1 Tax=Magnaporthiopsis poae (strain ATCC 64411 / 73-15) TaxID=644358 RepID=A0A0C4DNZ4_MAGP6|nr:guanyl-specific ribonuclease F1 [Magnaporthiopsis poae ATCC 64411]